VTELFRDFNDAETVWWKRVRRSFGISDPISNVVAWKALTGALGAQLAAQALPAGTLRPRYDAYRHYAGECLAGVVRRCASGTLWPTLLPDWLAPFAQWSDEPQSLGERVGLILDGNVTLLEPAIERLLASVLDRLKVYLADEQLALEQREPIQSVMKKGPPRGHEQRLSDSPGVARPY
jgi:hypothetical protein